MRKICYVTGSRADFGLMASTLQQANVDSRLSVFICATGQHFAQEFGETINEIETVGIPIAARIPVDLNGSDGAQMARAIGHELIGMTEAFEQLKPDIVMVLGDRGEMMAAALAALHLNIPVVHIHGGELSGTVDEPVRHAISKLSHYHFTATPGARERLIRMGEREETIFVTGAPGLDGITAKVKSNRAALASQFFFDAHKPIALLVFHPVLQEMHVAEKQAEAIISALRKSQVQILCLMPNSDGGGSNIRLAIDAAFKHDEFKVVDHMERSDYISWMAIADFMIGNSSSGIIEAAAFDLPVINVGSRQHGRERSGNVIDVSAEQHVLADAIEKILKQGRKQYRNVYGDGKAGKRIVELLATLPLTPKLLQKQNAY